MARIICKAGMLHPNHGKKPAGYLNYIATRDGVQPPSGYLSYMAERKRSHGLFSDGDTVSLQEAKRQMEEHTEVSWTFIVSIKREDATRLGYDNADAWRNVVRKHRNELAQQLKISPADLVWYAAFHNEGHHPHIHLVAWGKTTRGRMTKQGLERIRSFFGREVFQNDLINLYEVKTQCRTELVQASAKEMQQQIHNMQSGQYHSPVIEMKLRELSDELKVLSGKKVYGYLPPRLKSKVNAIIDELEQVEPVRKCYDAWVQAQEEIRATYTGQSMERLPLSQQKEFKKIRNDVIQVALHLGELPLTVQVISNAVPAPIKNPSSPEPDVAVPPMPPTPQSIQTKTPPSFWDSGVPQLLINMSRIFESNLPPMKYQGMQIDSTRRKELIRRKIAMGQRWDDHEYEEPEL